MKKEKQITPLTNFPTEVLVFYFKKFRKCRHYEYEDEWDNLVVEDVTTEPFTTKCDWRDDEMYVKFEGLYWYGKCHEFMDELNKRGNVNISLSNFKDWKREYKKTHANDTKRKEKTVLRK